MLAFLRKKRGFMGAYSKYVEEEEMPECFSDAEEYDERSHYCRTCDWADECRRHINLAEARSRPSSLSTRSSSPIRRTTAGVGVGSTTYRSGMTGVRNGTVLHEGNRITLRLDDGPTPLAGEAFGEMVTSGVADMLGESARLIKSLKIGPGGIVSGGMAAALDTGDRYLQIRRWRFGRPQAWNSKTRQYEDMDG